MGSKRGLEQVASIAVGGPVEKASRPGNSTSTLRDGATLLCDYVEDLWHGPGREGKTVELASPKELEAAFSESGCCMELDGAPVDEEGVMAACRLALRYSVKTNHPKFYNQLYGREEPVGLLGQWLTAATSGNCHTFEVCPVYTLTEVHVLRKFARLVSYPEVAEGLFCPGGSISNIYGMHLARYRMFPKAKEEGMWGCPPLVGFCSAHCHYSYQKAAHLVGLGTQNMVKVATNRSGQMCPEALEKAVQEALAAGKRPFFVGATEGSTVLGAFDDLKALRPVCDRHGMWLHADCAWGGPALLSEDPEVRALMDGIGGTDSYAFNPHKLMGVPLQCSVFQTRHHGILMNANKAGAAYLFQPDKENTQYDIGDKTIQCGRLPDSFKLWLTWKSIGDRGWAERVDKAMALAKFMEARMARGGYHGRFVSVLPRCFSNLCFWYIPSSFGEFDPHACAHGSEEWRRLHEVAKSIKARMQAEGKAMIGFQSIPLDGSDALPNFWRMVFASMWSVTEADMDETLADIDRIGAALFPEKA
jgi:glutamate/tyrosine decarboxylase-like PLP-dependent enzyme